MAKTVQFDFCMKRKLFVPFERLKREVVDFLESPDPSVSSLDSIGETEALEWIRDDPNFLRVVLNSIGVHGRVCVDSAVTTPFLRPRGEGDLDLFVAKADCPATSFAFQFKRFKVRLEDGTEIVSMERKKLDKLIEQCNRTFALGFHQVYCVILVMTDARNHPAPSYLHHRPSDDPFKKLYQSVLERPLTLGVGVAFAEMIQPTESSVEEYGIFSMGVADWARRVEQTPGVSEKVSRWCSNMAKKGKAYNIDSRPTGEPIPVKPEDSLRMIVDSRCAFSTSMDEVGNSGSERPA